MTSVVLLVLILLVEMAAIVSLCPVVTLTIALIIIHHIIGIHIGDNVRTRVINNLGLMILELVEVCRHTSASRPVLLAAWVGIVVAWDIMCPLICVVYGGVLGETLRRTVRLLGARLAHFITIIIKPLNFIKQALLSTHGRLVLISVVISEALGFLWTRISVVPLLMAAKTNNFEVCKILIRDAFLFVLKFLWINLVFLTVGRLVTLLTTSIT